MLRGTPEGLEFVFADGSFDDLWTEMSGRLAERPEFYRGSRAAVIFETGVPDSAGLAAVVAALRRYDISLRGVYGGGGCAVVAERLELPYLGAPPRPAVTALARKRGPRAPRPAELSDSARSLKADFAGARADIADRRARGEASVPKPEFEPRVVPQPVPAAVTLYHCGTLRGGQTLQHAGTIVVAGDVNPGAELVATGDICVFGSLRGTAHAGAQGDATARVLALELVATQLRIAAFIAAGDGTRRALEPEVAFVDGGRIAIDALAKVGMNR
jgi:septum formation inhibitor MinC